MKTKGIKRRTRYFCMHTTNNAVHIVIARNYWRAFKKAQRWFNSDTQIRVWKDTLSTV